MLVLYTRYFQLNCFPSHPTSNFRSVYRVRLNRDLFLFFKEPVFVSSCLETNFSLGCVVGGGVLLSAAVCCEDISQVVLPSFQNLHVNFAC